MLGWRDGILLLVAVAAVYLVFMLIKLTQLGRQHHEKQAVQTVPASPESSQEPSLDSPAIEIPSDESEPLRGTGATALYASNMMEAEGLPASHETGGATPMPVFEWDEVKSLFGDAVESPAGIGQESLAERPGGFGEHLSEHLARSDMEAEVQRMKDEMDRMRGEMEALRAASRVSPHYAEAMEMAQRGLTAQDLADRLGISLGEAELVHALSQTDRDYEEGEENGAGSFATRQPGSGGFQRR